MWKNSIFYLKFYRSIFIVIKKFMRRLGLTKLFYKIQRSFLMRQKGSEHKYISVEDAIRRLNEFSLNPGNSALRNRTLMSERYDLEIIISVYNWTVKSSQKR